jgi:hypothetical protein
MVGGGNEKTKVIVSAEWTKSIRSCSMNEAEPAYGTATLAVSSTAQRILRPESDSECADRSGPDAGLTFAQLAATAPTGPLNSET